MTQLDTLTFISERVLTQEEFASWAARRPRGDDNKYELLGGRIVMTPPSGWPEGETEAELAHVLKSHVTTGGLGRVFGPSQGFELPTGDTVAPDGSFVSRARWEAAPPPEPGRFLRVVPELVIEVTTPDGRPRDAIEKRAIYARAGVLEYWIIDQRRREITAFHALGEGRFDDGRTYAESDAIASRVLPELLAAVRDLLVKP